MQCQQCGKHQDQSDGAHRNAPRQFCHLSDQRRFSCVLGSVGQHRADPRQQCRGACFNRDALAAAFHHDSSGVRHREPVACNGLGIKQEIGVFQDRHRFPGERAFIDPEAVRIDEAHVGRHLHPAFQFDDVTGHYLCSGDFLHSPIADDTGDLGHQVSQCARACVGLVFLIAADKGIGCQDAEDEHGIQPVTDGQGKKTGDNEQIDQRVGELARKYVDQTCSPDLWQQVGAVLGQAFIDFALGKAAIPRVLLHKHFGSSACVPGLIGPKAIILDRMSSPRPCIQLRSWDGPPSEGRSLREEKSARYQ